MRRPLIKALLMATLGIASASANALASSCNGPMDVQTTQPKARPEFRPERQEEIKRRLSSEHFGAITLGDSIMEGWGPRFLESAFDQPTLNSGFGMDGTEQLLWRIQSMDWSQQKPKHVLLLVGTNDLKFPTCSVVQGVLAVVRAVHGVLPSAKIVVTSILPRGENMLEHDAEIVQINEDLAAAQSEQHFRFFNVHDAFYCNHKTPCALFQAGNLHLTPLGYQLLTDSLRQFLQQIAAGAPQTPQIWLDGLDPISRRAKYPDMPSDYMDMFQPNAPWNHAAAAVRVFELGPKFVVEASDEMLSKIFADLKQRNIAVAIGASWLPASETCGRGVEGFTHPGTAATVANRIHRLGGDVTYVVMDEPLYFGHEYSKQNACQWPIPEVAGKLAVEIAAFQRVFPSAQVCDVEPVAIPGAGWVNEIMQWARAYQSATRQSLACFQADVQWTGPWQQQLSELGNRLHAAGMKLGVIYNGDGKARTGLEWTQQAEQRMALVETGPELMPDQALIQSWTREPDRMLPENQPGTLTNLVLRFLTVPSGRGR